MTPSELPPNEELSEETFEPLIPLPLPVVDLNSAEFVQKPLSSVKVTFEFLLITLSKCLNLKPVQCAGLLTNNYKFWQKAMQKGVKDHGFSQLQKWFELLHRESNTLLACMHAEFQEYQNVRTFTDVLNTILAGLGSRNEQIVSLTFSLLSKLLRQIENLGIKPINHMLFDWLVKQT